MINIDLMFVSIFLEFTELLFKTTVTMFNHVEQATNKWKYSLSHEEKKIKEYFGKLFSKHVLHLE